MPPATAAEDAAAFAGRSVRVVSGAKNARFFLQKVHNITPTPGMVAQCHDIYAVVKHTSRDVRCDSETCGRILTVNDDKIRRVHLMKCWQHGLDSISADLSYNIPEH